jgi:hypothetical protein
VGASLAIVTIVGAVLAIASVATHLHWSRRLHERVPAEVLFPSDEPDA